LPVPIIELPSSRNYPVITIFGRQGEVVVMSENFPPFIELTWDTPCSEAEEKSPINDL
jgi:hypothetical protein